MLLSRFWPVAHCYALLMLNLFNRCCSHSLLTIEIMNDLISYTSTLLYYSYNWYKRVCICMCMCIINAFVIVSYSIFLFFIFCVFFFASVTSIINTKILLPHFRFPFVSLFAVFTFFLFVNLTLLYTVLCRSYCR